ncbi:MarR family winged helix-turn-helix transcriptional regulator [Fulvivirga sediminis]|uniref:MarR family transcriptional regulator n=1 Tax=Fulvivirga sediminis TaxID=2803949 RepID=A0A937FAT0_9BACT|nr:MarR family transcriptional regulator [Fulvivirga sediminis]MBL3658820.1 MarR family transcriptional regulator [Fulvivirga sediminis]
MDILVDALTTVISGLHKTIRRSFSDSSSFSLTELQTIALINRNGKILPSELATKTKITTPSMSQILKKMEMRGIINRQSCDSDKRKVFISLSKAGKDIVEQARFSRNEALKTLIDARLNVDEIKILEQALPILQKLNA